MPIKLAFPVTLTCTRTTLHGAAAVAQRILQQGTVAQRNFYKEQFDKEYFHREQLKRGYPKV